MGLGKVSRSVSQAISTPKKSEAVDLYKGDSKKNVVWGSESNANFIDVISVAPISEIKEMYVNETNINDDEFPNSKVQYHLGYDSYTPWAGGSFPYVENTYQVSKHAEVRDDEATSITSFTKTVSNLGVQGIRVNFTSGSFTHRDKKNRRRIAEAYFVVNLLNDSGQVVRTATTANYKNFFSTNPVQVQATLLVPTEYLSKHWTYRVDMRVKGRNYSTQVAGNWSCSTVTELFKDTQTYKDIALCAGKIVASEVGGSTPKRQYLVKGYKVLIPDLLDMGGGNFVFNGKFKRDTSDSPAWNAVAVLTDDKWGAGYPIDKINTSSFYEFQKYCDQVVGGVKRYSFSQALTKQDNYFKLASQIVGSADGKLYEDTNGRIGVLIDRKTNNRRVVNSYDLVGEKVKRTTVPDTKKVNHVEGEFDDKSNKYKKTIIEVSNQDSITVNGVVTKKLRLDSCTDSKEAYRVINKVLVTSQVTTTSYALSLGHSHEDIQIGEVLEVYDRKYSRANYCGKLAANSTTTDLVIDKRTPIDLSMMTNPKIVFDNGRKEPIVADIQSWTSSTIKLSSPLVGVSLEEFKSFGVKDSVSGGLRPTLIKVMGTNVGDDGVIQVEGVAYNHSLYDHVDSGAALIVENEAYLPPEDSHEITGLVLSRTSNSVKAEWDAAPLFTYSYHWKRYENDKDVLGTTIKDGKLPLNSVSTELPFPLDPVTYKFIIYAEKDGNITSSKYESIDLSVDFTGTSPLNPVSTLGIYDGMGGILGEYGGRDFTLAWTHTTGTGQPELHSFIVRISQSSKTLELKVGKDIREIYVSEKELTDTFGEKYLREFTVSIIAVDEDLLSTAAKIVTVNNPAPPAPIIDIAVTGDITLTGSKASDVIGARFYIWKGVITDPVPTNSIPYDVDETGEIVVPDDIIVYDDSTYIYAVAWYDDFGSTELLYAKKEFTASRSLLVPESPELIEVIPVSDIKVRVNFEHDGTWLKRIKRYYRRYATADDWTEVAAILNIPKGAGEDTHDYNPSTREGYFFVDGLVPNTDYEFKATVSNETGAFSEDSNIVVGKGVFALDVDEILSELDDVLGGVDPRELIAEGVLDAFGDLDLEKNIIQEKITRNTEEGVLVASLNRLQAELEKEGKKSTSRYTDLITAVSTTESALIQKVELLETEFKNKDSVNAASFSNVVKAISDEKSSRVAAIDNLDTRVTNDIQHVTGELTNIRSLITGEDGSEATSVESLRVRLQNETTTRESQVSSLQQAVTNEQTTRTQDITALTAKVNSQSDDIATALSTSSAAIGWCDIGSGTQGSQQTEGECQAAGGTWMPTPFAEGVRRVQVSSGGSTATVGSMYSAFVDLDGKITGKATIGVDANGVFTGLKVIGGTDISKMIFSGDSVEFRDSSGTPQLSYSNGIWNFTGTILASKIKGDVVGAMSSDLSGEVGGKNIGGSTRIIKHIEIEADSFARTLKIDPIFADGTSDDYGELVDIEYFKKVGSGGYTRDVLRRIRFPDNRLVDSTPTVVLDIPANEVVRVRIEANYFNRGTYTTNLFGTFFAEIFRQTTTMKDI